MGLKLGKLENKYLAMCSYSKEVVTKYNKYSTAEAAAAARLPGPQTAAPVPSLFRIVNYCYPCATPPDQLLLTLSKVLTQRFSHMNRRTGLSHE